MHCLHQPAVGGIKGEQARARVCHQGHRRRSTLVLWATQGYSQGQHSAGGRDGVLDHRCVCLNQEVQLLIHCSSPEVVSLRSLFLGFRPFVLVLVWSTWPFLTLVVVLISSASVNSGRSQLSDHRNPLWGLYLQRNWPNVFRRDPWGPFPIHGTLLYKRTPIDRHHLFLSAAGVRSFVSVWTNNLIIVPTIFLTLPPSFYFWFVSLLTLVQESGTTITITLTSAECYDNNAIMDRTLQRQSLLSVLFGHGSDRCSFLVVFNRNCSILKVTSATTFERISGTSVSDLDLLKRTIQEWRRRQEHFLTTLLHFSCYSSS